MGLPPYIEALLKGSAYPERPASVELRQTHISYLFFTPGFVYKIKKPVAFAFLDFSTLEKRLFYCNEEVRLNARLAPDMYLGVAPVTDDNGKITLNGKGHVVDYAVKMKRLKQETLLEEMIKNNAATEETARKIAAVIAEFHARAATGGRIAAFGFPAEIRRNAEDNFSQTLTHIERTISERLHNSIRENTLAFLDANSALFQKRVDDGFIRDCHGDIHCENVSIENGVVRIFDCIEFSERFRASDTVADIAFLAMDVDFHNERGLSETLAQSYFSVAKDAGGEALLDFYKSCRAFIRGKVDGLKALEPEVPAAERTDALLSAMRHFHLAGQYLAKAQKPMLIIVCGLSATGKTTLAKRLSEVFFAPRLSSDGVRKILAGIPPQRQSPEQFKRGIYSDEFTEKTYAALIKGASDFLAQGKTCVLDATFSREKHRRLSLETARLANADFLIIELTLDDETIKGRLASRRETPTPGVAVSDMTNWELLLQQKKAFEPVNEPHMTLSAKTAFDDNVIAVVKRICK